MRRPAPSIAFFTSVAQRRGDPAVRCACGAAVVAGEATGLLTGEGAAEMFGGYLRYDVSRLVLARWLPNTYRENTDRATMAAGVEVRTPFSTGDRRMRRGSGHEFGKSALRRLLVQRLPCGAASRWEEGLGGPVPRLLAAASARTVAVAWSPATR